MQQYNGRMNLRALQYFVKLADLRHFSKAAEACFVSQPTLSTQIKKLENDIGLVLTGQISKKISLTDASKALHQASRDILDVHTPSCNIRVR